MEQGFNVIILLKDAVIGYAKRNCSHYWNLSCIWFCSKELWDSYNTWVLSSAEICDSQFEDETNYMTKSPQ
jgi:hypothetical protein